MEKAHCVFRYDRPGKHRIGRRSNSQGFRPVLPKQCGVRIKVKVSQIGGIWRRIIWIDPISKIPHVGVENDVEQTFGVVKPRHRNHPGKVMLKSLRVNKAGAGLVL